MIAADKTIVVTGITGYLGKWIAHALLEKGYSVRGTLRDLNKRRLIENSLGASLGEEAVARLSFVEAELLEPKDWPEALSGAEAIMHAATRVVGTEPRDADSVIRPAFEGTRNVLEAARAVGVKRIVYTSSIATVGYGQNHTRGKRVYTEDNWTDLGNMRWKWAYCIGKTRAERFAWSYARENGLQLTTIHPGMILGPPFDADAGVSIGLISGLLTGKPSAYPDMGYSLSDVRDVADMHVAALENDAAIGQRYLCTAPYLHFSTIADVLRAAYPQAPVPGKSIPNWLLHVLAYLVRDIRQVVNDIGNEKHFDGARGRALLGRDYRNRDQTILDTAKKLVELGLVPSLTR